VCAALRCWTQQDPIGLAGGLNLYGFAHGDPVNFSDPFGLCEKNDGMCLALVRLLRQQQGDEFQTAASRYDALRGGRVRFVPGSSDVFNAYGRGNLNTDSDPWSFTGGTNSGPNVWLNADLERGDFLIAAVHESYHLPDPFGPGLSHGSEADTRAIKDAERRAYNQLSPELRDKAPLTAHWLNSSDARSEQ